MSTGLIPNNSQDGTVTELGAVRDERPQGNTCRIEMFAFVVLAILFWPVLTIGVVGGYGLVVWMSQIVFGPPGPPH